MFLMSSFLSNDVSYLLHIVDGETVDDINPHGQNNNKLQSVLETYAAILDQTILQNKDDFLTALTAMNPAFGAVLNFNFPAYVTSMWNDRQNVRLSGVINKWVDMICNGAPTHLVVALLHMTSHLERILGDVFLTRGKMCPFLLRDLLASQELSDICSPWRMKLLQLLLGGPFSLNLRNLTWHGFVAPGEIPVTCSKMLLACVCELYSFLYAEFHLESIYTRPLIQINTMVGMLKERFHVSSMQPHISQIKLLTETSPYLPKSMLPYYIYSLDQYLNQQYYNCVLTLLPQVETLLRCRFAKCNNIPHRLMTAQSTEFYTTMDEILAEFWGDSQENAMKHYLTEPFMVLLMDLFDQPEGLRLRDRMSHGELEPSCVTQYVADVIIAIVTCASHRPMDTRKTNNSSGQDFCPTTCICYGLMWLSDLYASIANYESTFHPLGVAKRLARECFGICVEANGLAQSAEAEGVRGTVVDERMLAELDEARTRLIRSWHGAALLDEKTDAETVVESLLQKRVETLYRTDGKNQEASVLLRQVAESSLVAARNILEALRGKAEDLRAKKLRSRQRKNYQRLLNCRPVLTSALAFNCCAVLVFIHQRYDSDKFAALRRDFKALLRISEKLSNFTSREVNKWDEAAALSSDLCQLFG